MAEFNTSHYISLQNASRFFSGALVKFCHISVNFFTRLAKFVQNLSDGCYVILSSKSSGSQHPQRTLPCTSQQGRRPLLFKSDAES